MSTTELLTPVVYRHPETCEEKMISFLSEHFYLGGRKIVVIERKTANFQVETQTLPNRKVALKVASYVLLFPITCVLFVTYLTLKQRHQYSEAPPTTALDQTAATTATAGRELNRSPLPRPATPPPPAAGFRLVRFDGLGPTNLGPESSLPPSEFLGDDRQTFPPLTARAPAVGHTSLLPPSEFLSGSPATPPSATRPPPVGPEPLVPNGTSPTLSLHLASSPASSTTSSRDSVATANSDGDDH